jgi:hypothetical protein
MPTSVAGIKSRARKRGLVVAVIISNYGAAHHLREGTHVANDQPQ